MDREKAENRREIVDLKINKIVQNRKKDLPQEDNKKAEAKKEENEDSDEEGKVNQSIYKNQQMTKYSKESETKVIYFNIFIIGRNQTQGRKKTTWSYADLLFI